MLGNPERLPTLDSNDSLENVASHENFSGIYYFVIMRCYSENATAITHSDVLNLNNFDFSQAYNSLNSMSD